MILRDHPLLAGIELHSDLLSRVLYATDASIYREHPLGVAYPQNAEEIQRLVQFAERQNIALIPRAAGTSLAGQCVGSGLVVDVSRYMNRLLEFNEEERWVRVEPGMVRDELNQFLRDYGLWFAPNTSTSNRCTLGGMAGNNSCGSTSIAYGTTRDHVLELEVVLSSGEQAVFGAVDSAAFAKCLQKPGREGEIYRRMHHLLGDEKVQKEVQARYPKPEIHRRNTAYALDVLLQSAPYKPQGPPLNLARLLCGSEGTLAFTTALKLSLEPLPPPEQLLLLPHFHSLSDALEAVQTVVRHKIYACELMDKALLDCTRNSKAQQPNRFFLQGDPAAVLMIECRGENKRAAKEQAERIISDLKKEGRAYDFPVLSGADIGRVWALRKAGLGILANLPGRARAIACVEDTAVAVADLPDYIRDFSRMMSAFGQRAIYYAHAGAGELHIRPILDLYKESDFRAFRQICEASANLVARYRGSLSGEHGDGRLRAEFIPLVLGEQVQSYLEEVKTIWDPRGLLNPGKIVRAPRMDEGLRFSPKESYPQVDTLLDFSEQGGFFGAAWRCTGSGDCRKSHRFAGNMCPSFQATRDEKHSTRGRANALRELLQASSDRPFDQKELKEVLDLCLSCKACTAECPSGVNMTALKSEFLYQYYRHHTRPLRDFLFARLDSLLALSARLNAWPQRLMNSLAGKPLRLLLGFSPRRKLPVPKRRHFFKVLKSLPKTDSAWRGRVCLFVDPFTNYLEPELALSAWQLLSALGYEVVCPERPGAGRPLLSKGFLQEARRLAEKQVTFFHRLTEDGSPLIGLEPSEVLSFRDEYPVLLGPSLRTKARELAGRSFLLEEFLAGELKSGRLSPDEIQLKEPFAGQKGPLVVQLHCHQKAWTSVEDFRFLLEIAANSSPGSRSVHILDAGCCGMAGAFGYEKEHYTLSCEIGALRLFPTLRALPAESLIVATGNSCRQQIRDLTGQDAQALASILRAC